MRPALAFASGLAAVAVLAAAASRAQPEATTPDIVERLQQRIAAGEVRLEHTSGPWSYLPSLLKALDIPVDSQVLVFSKTSLQFQEISPSTPRAIYFNDDTAVGAVQGGRLLEVITTAADGRIAFYALDTAPQPTPKFQREGEECLACHATVNKWAPGLIVANVIPQDDGSPLFITTDRLFDMTDANTPFEKRWGGWYVSGEHGAMRHNGNVHATPDNPGELDPKAGLNLTDLSGRFDVKPYLAPTSDIVALMTLEHQIGAMNRIWALQGQARALRGQSTRQVSADEVDEAVEDLVAYLVGVDQAQLTAPVKGVSTFTRTFAERGPRDARGRSLRDFDLRTRLFRYPLSYMVYSRALEGIEPAIRERLYRRLFDVLSGADASPRFAKLSPEERQAALEILRETKPDLPAYWRTPAA